MNPQEIYNNVYVGNDETYDKLKDKANWSFLRPIKYGPGGHQDILKYTTLAAPDGKYKYWAVRGKNLMALNILDLDDPYFVPWDAIQKGLEFVNQRRLASDKVLIACNAGHSRGPTTGLMYLRSIGDMPWHFVKSEHIYRTLYPKFDPGQGMRQFARMHWNDLDNLEIK
jgi:hypothetical protein